jgi:hypothetical protein
MIGCHLATVNTLEVGVTILGVQVQVVVATPQVMVATTFLRFTIHVKVHPILGICMHPCDAQVDSRAFESPSKLTFGS